MNDWTGLEALRQVEQSRLDALKDARERNRLGQFATPFDLARHIAEYVWHLIGSSKDPIRFLDPAIGSGAFYSALRSTIDGKVLRRSLGVEIDPAFAGAARSIWGDTGLEIVEGDFTKQQPSDGERFNVVIANPPYVRHHHICAGDKERLKRASSPIAGADVSGLTGLYCYFLLLCHNWLAEDGIGVWLIPSEFMDVNYGSAVRHYLTSKVSLIHIHRFRPSDVQFDDALVSSVVVVLRKSAPMFDSVTRFSYGGDLCHPQIERFVAASDLAKATKWTQFSTEIGDCRPARQDSGSSLGDLFLVKRGIATGANSFFILPRDLALQKGFPRQCIRPILPSPRRLSEAIIEADEDGYPLIDQPLALIDTGYPEGLIKAEFPALWAYLQAGKERGVHQTYLTSRRSPWYYQEQRSPAPFVCTYMGRGKPDANLFRFMWNRSRATAPNVFLLLYPMGQLQEALAADQSLYPKVLAALQSIGTEELIGAGRVYGGGLYKLEPRELTSVSAKGIIRVIGESKVSREQKELALF